jgi:hypothetical protein
MAAGRPASIIGGDKWEAEVIKVSPKNAMDASKTIVIGTGCGGLLLIVSAKTGLVYTLSFIPHKKANLDGPDILKYLSNKYHFDKTGYSTIQVKDSSFIQLAVLAGSILIVAMTDDLKELRFEN